MKFCQKKDFPIPLCCTPWNASPSLKIWVIFPYLVKHSAYSLAQHTPGVSVTHQTLAFQIIYKALLTSDRFPWTAAAAWLGVIATINLPYDPIAELSCLPAIPAGIIHYYVVSCCLAMVSVVTC